MQLCAMAAWSPARLEKWKSVQEEYSQSINASFERKYLRAKQAEEEANAEPETGTSQDWLRILDHCGEKEYIKVKQELWNNSFKRKFADRLHELEVGEDELKRRKQAEKEEGERKREAALEKVCKIIDSPAFLQEMIQSRNTKYFLNPSKRDYHRLSTQELEALIE